MKKMCGHLVLCAHILNAKSLFRKIIHLFTCGQMAKVIVTSLYTFICADVQRVKFLFHFCFSIHSHYGTHKQTYFHVICQKTEHKKY